MQPRLPAYHRPAVLVSGGYSHESSSACHGREAADQETRAIYKLLQRMEKLAGRSGLAALRRELQVGMGWCHEVVEVLRQAEVQIPGKANDGQT